MHLLMYAFSLKDNTYIIDMRNIPTRGHHGVKLRIKKVNNPRYYRSIYYRAVDAWNKLDASYTTIVDKEVFKRRITSVSGTVYTENRPDPILM